MSGCVCVETGCKETNQKQQVLGTRLCERKKKKCSIQQIKKENQTAINFPPRPSQIHTRSTVNNWPWRSIGDCNIERKYFVNLKVEFKTKSKTKNKSARIQNDFFLSLQDKHQIIRAVSLVFIVSPSK